MPAFLLDAPAILVPCKKEQWCYSERTFGDIYAQRTMTRAEVEHAASMFFTDVRLKTYIEIRPADALPIPYVISYAALVKGLFYDAANLDALDALFSDVRGADVEAAKDALMESGYGARGIRTPRRRSGRLHDKACPRRAGRGRTSLPGPPCKAGGCARDAGGPRRALIAAGPGAGGCRARLPCRAPLRRPVADCGDLEQV